MKSTFHYKQELKSSEFGTLLKDLLPAGIYRTPSITVQDSTVTVTGGTYLFYNSSSEEGENSNPEFAICVRFEQGDSRQISESSMDGKYVCLSYQYSGSINDTVSISLQDSPSSDGKYITLGRIKGASIDTSFADYRGPGYSYPNPEVTELVYTPNSTLSKLAVAVSGYYLTNSGLKTIPRKEFNSLDNSHGYYVYVDQEGSLQVADLGTGSGSKIPIAELLGRKVIAYKDPGSDVFAIVRFPTRGELTAASLSISPVTPGQDTDALNNIYDRAKTATSGSVYSSGLPVLENVVHRLVAEVQALRKELGKKPDSGKTVWERLKAEENATEAAKESITTNNLTVNSSFKTSGASTISGDVTFDNATITMKNGTNLGSRTNPIENMYVSNVLYAENLEFYSRTTPTS